MTQQVGGVHIAALERARAAFFDAFGGGFMCFDLRHDNLPVLHSHYIVAKSRKTKVDHNIYTVKKTTGRIERFAAT